MKFFFISPIGRKSDRLFDTIIPTFTQRGHQIVDNYNNADYFLFDIWCGFGEYDSAVFEHILKNNLSVAILDFFDYNDAVKWKGFDFWEGVKETEDWAKYSYKLWERGLIEVYFMYKMNSKLEYPSYVYPISPALYPDHIFTPYSKEQLFERPFDVCFVGAKSPDRKAVIDAIIADGRLKIYYQYTADRIPHEEWLEKHRMAKFFLSADGGGYGDERMQQLITISPMLRQRNNQVFVKNWSDGVNFIGISPETATKDIYDIISVTNDKDYLYEMYMDGIEFAKKYYSEAARANYILDKIAEIRGDYIYDEFGAIAPLN